MDINTAEIQVKKLLKYVEDIEAKKPTLYRKSKDRLRDLASDCTQVVKLISSILQDETLMYDDSEFSTSQRGDIYKMIESMESEVTRMKQFVGYPGSAKSTTNRISQQDRIAVLNLYKDTFHAAFMYDTPYGHVHNCAKLLWDWFDARFVNSSTKHPNFRYNIRRIKDWTVGVVVLYGKHHEDGDLHKYIQDYKTWLNSLDDRSSDKYAVPYEVYQYCKTWNPSYLTLSSVVIWDVLKDAGLSRLFSYGGDLMPEEDKLYSMCADDSPDILDRYRNYQFDESIITECRLKGVDVNAL